MARLAEHVYADPMEIRHRESLEVEHVNGALGSET